MIRQKNPLGCKNSPSHGRGGVTDNSKDKFRLQTGSTQMGVEMDRLHLSGIVAHSNFATVRIDLDFLHTFQRNRFPGALLPVSSIHAINPK